jgi:hypothetical protein
MVAERKSRYTELLPMVKALAATVAVIVGSFVGAVVIAPGVSQSAVAEVSAVKTCPAEGAAAALTDTVVVADFKPLATVAVTDVKAFHPALLSVAKYEARLVSDSFFVAPAAALSEIATVSAPAGAGLSVPAEINAPKTDQNAA